MKPLKLLFKVLNPGKLCFVPLLILSSSLTYAQSWMWAKHAYGSYKTNQSAYVATDEAGDAYLAGCFYGPGIFSPDTINFVASNYDAYLVKYNSAGTVLWAIAPSSGIYSACNAVTADKSDCPYVTGNFDGTIKFGSTTLNGNSYDGGTLFVAKYTPAGNPIWAKGAVTTSLAVSSATGMGIATDITGHVFVTGNFTDTISIGPDTLITQPILYTSSVFLAKYDTSGKVLWAKQAVVPSKISYGYACSVATDPYGYIYETGYFKDTISFGSYTLISNKKSSVYLVKYSTAGNVLWAKQSKNSSLNDSAVGYSVTTDQGGNAYITGYFTDTVNFSSQTLFSSSISVFLTKYDSNGNVSWAQKSTGAYNFIAGTSLASSGDSIYLAGTGGFYGGYFNNITFRSLTIFGIQPAYQSQASFIIKFDTAGNPACGSVIDGLGCDFYISPASDAAYGNNFIYLAGTFTNDTVFYVPDTLIINGFDNISLGRWQKCSITGVNELNTTNNELSVYPNPSNGIFTLESSVVSDQLSVEIYNVLGEKIYSNSFIIQNSTFKIDINDKPSGIYLYRVLTESGDLVGEGKLIKE